MNFFPSKLISLQIRSEFLIASDLLSAPLSHERNERVVAINIAFLGRQPVKWLMPR